MDVTHPESGSDYLAPGEAAKVAGISVSTLLRAEAAGKIESQRTPGGHRRFRRDDAARLLQPAAGAREKASA